MLVSFHSAKLTNLNALKDTHMHANNMLSNPEACAHLIIIMGVSGSGKSTLAEILAQHYGYTYLDGDNFHSSESRNLMAQGIALTDVERTPWVAALKQRLESCAASNTHVVLAFSGLKQKHRNELRNAGLRTLFLFLHGNKDIIKTRMNNRQGHFASPQLLDSQFDSLENPLPEKDVYAIDIAQHAEDIIAQAIAVVDNAFVSA
jgi:gluconokinase